MRKIIGYLDKKSIGYLDCCLVNNKEMNSQSKYPEFSNRLNQVWKECVEAPSNQTHLSKWLGFAQPTVNNWINGNALPGLETAVNLADRFRCNPIWLITGKGPKRHDDKQPSSPLLDKFNQLCPDQQREVTEFIDFKLSQKPANKPLTAQPEKCGGGVNLHDPLSDYKRRQNQAADKPFCDAVKRDIEDSQKKDAVTKEDYGSTLT